VERGAHEGTAPSFDNEIARHLPDVIPTLRQRQEPARSVRSIQMALPDRRLPRALATEPFPPPPGRGLRILIAVVAMLEALYSGRRSAA